MYEQVFNFNSRPFTSTPYVKHYFPASAMNQAFGQASICIERGSGPVVAIGDIGTGKSLLLAKLESEYQTKLQVVNLVCSGVSNRREFLQNILFQIGKPFNMDSETELRFAVIQSAQPTEAFPNGLLLLVDDAEMLTADIFDEMRALSNVVVDGSPQVRLVLAGRKSLEELLADPALASFSQRIASRVFLTNLSREETAAYVVEHINRVGGDGQTVFPSETAAKLHELTDGCPRLINQVCDFGLILAGTRGSTTVSATLIEEAWNDVQSLPMGSGSMPSASQSQPTETTEENEWTLIEFGQLDDDSPEPADATVYDFGSSDPAEESIVGYSPQESEVVAAHQPQPIEVAAPQPPTPSSNIDPELGIDLASLQAMQDAAGASNSTDAAADDTYTTMGSQEVTPADDRSVETENEISPDDAARIAMEQQLAAVFGTSLPSSAPEPETQDISSAADDQPDQSFDSTPASDVAPETSDAQNVVESPSVPEAGNAIVGATGAALAAGAFATAFNSFAPEAPKTPEAPESVNTSEIPATSAIEDSFRPATSALGDNDPGTETPSASEQPSILPTAPTQPEPTAPEADPASSFTPAFPVDEAAGFVPATQPIEAAEVPTEPQVENPTISEATAAPASPVLDDPFNESFAVEASIPHRPTSDIIEQNQNALKISSADLEHVQPLHEPTPDEIIHPPTSEAPQVDQPTTEAPVDDTLSAATADATAVEASHQPSEFEPATTPLAESPEITRRVPDEASMTEPEKISRGFSILPMGESAIPATTSEPVEPPTSFEPTQPSSLADTPAEVETLTAGPESPSTTHNHTDDVASAEISRQADEILARLHNANKPTAIDQEEQILADIQSQQREMTDSQLLGEQEQQQTSLPIPTPDSHQDDSGMLVVKPEAGLVEETVEPETFPIADSPISSGRASRMDYEQLFDRLRNLPENDQK